MSKIWRKMSGAQTRALVSSCSLLILGLLGPIGFAQSKAQPELRQEASDIFTSRKPASSLQRDAARNRSNPLYYDAGKKQGGNWIQKAFERIGDFFRGRRAPAIRTNVPNVGVPNLTWVIYVVYAILGIIVLGALALVISAIRIRRRLRRSVGLMDATEPLRTDEEWLALAEEFAKEGKRREAVRCFYLAILVRLDRANWLRFDRRETNWEHLQRYEGQTHPAMFDLRTFTKIFDLVWYGYIVRDEDLVAMRGAYFDLDASVRQNP